MAQLAWTSNNSNIKSQYLFYKIIVSTGLTPYWQSRVWINAAGNSNALSARASPAEGRSLRHAPCHHRCWTIFCVPTTKWHELPQQHNRTFDCRSLKRWWLRQFRSCLNAATITQRRAYFSISRFWSCGHHGHFFPYRVIARIYLFLRWTQSVSVSELEVNTSALAELIQIVSFSISTVSVTMTWILLASRACTVRWFERQRQEGNLLISIMVGLHIILIPFEYYSLLGRSWQFEQSIQADQQGFDAKVLPKGICLEAGWLQLFRESWKRLQHHWQANTLQDRDCHSSIRRWQWRNGWIVRTRDDSARLRDRGLRHKSAWLPQYCHISRQSNLGLLFMMRYSFLFINMKQWTF